MLPVARITKLFGTNGGVALALYPAFPPKFNPEEPLFVSIDALTVPLFLHTFQRKGVNGAHVQFDDFDSDARVMELIGKELFIEGMEEENDEFTFAELIGFEVKIDKQTGRITDFYDNDLNPLFEISLDGRGGILIPATEDFIARIDFKKKIIKFVLPEGLLEL